MSSSSHEYNKPQKSNIDNTQQSSTNKRKKTVSINTSCSYDRNTAPEDLVRGDEYNREEGKGSIDQTDGESYFSEVKVWNWASEEHGVQERHKCPGDGQHDDQGVADPNRTVEIGLFVDFVKEDCGSRVHASCKSLCYLLLGYVEVL